jgi:hypothetical protein
MKKSLVAKELVKIAKSLIGFTPFHDGLNIHPNTIFTCIKEADIGIVGGSGTKVIKGHMKHGDKFKVFTIFATGVDLEKDGQRYRVPHFDLLFHYFSWNKKPAKWKSTQDN